MQVVGHRAQHSPYPQLGGAQALASLKPGLTGSGMTKVLQALLGEPDSPPLSAHTPGVSGVAWLCRSGPATKDACSEVGAGGGGGRMATLWLHSSVCTWAVSLSTLLFSRSFSHLCIAAHGPLLATAFPTPLSVPMGYGYTSHRTSFFIPLILTCLSGLKKTQTHLFHDLISHPPLSPSVYALLLLSPHPSLSLKPEIAQQFISLLHHLLVV